MFRLRSPIKKPITTATAVSTFPLTGTAVAGYMDPVIWAGLPDYLLDHILSFLPFHNLVALRSISRHLRSLLLCPTFLSDRSFSLPSFLLLSHPQSFRSFPLFDPSLHSWRTLPLPFSLPLTCASSLLSSSRGLLCFSLPSSSSSSLAVCNPLTNSSRLVKFPFYPFSFELLAIVASPDGHHFRIFTLCSSSSSSGVYSSVFVYDSRDRSWRKSDGFDQVLPRGFHQDGVFYKGSLYFAGIEPFTLVSVDLDGGKWTSVAGIGEFLAGDELTFVRLVSDTEGKKLYMVGGIGSNGISRSIKIWEKREEMDEWVELETLPEMICRKFTSVCYHNYEHVYCLWHKGTICICCYSWPEILFFHVGKRTWHWVPKCPSLPEKWSCGFRWFSFVPTLSASV
ncbi:PREDICTED: F-box/kelch-repeat protein At5g43190 [Tarenaya hassleriana]|uniref:F-box/kelch-repeat protein At5g43190 n=1 Tax=Tarenaya hassleriana TaxID=28532 RepID=UPI00053C84A3|nr:PREDICTED: F-box/kelch-repeat protein At5g43190 [Tarenaya hassleriana]